MLESNISFSSLYWISIFFQCRLFNKNSRKSKENVCEQWEITETNKITE